MARKCSDEPQMLKEPGEVEWWYYESPGSIEIFVDAGNVRDCAARQIGLRFRIPRRLLNGSLKRMNASRRKRKDSHD